MLATASGVRDCLKGLSEAIVKVVPAEHQAQVLSALGLTATAAGMIGTVAGAGVSVVALAALIVCRAKKSAAEHDERTEELRARERTLAYLQALSTRVEQVYARQDSARPTEQMIELVKAAVAEEFAAQRDQTAEELGLSPDEVRDLTIQLGLFATDLKQIEQKIDLISEDIRHRPWLELRRPSADPDLFLYRDMAIPFVGREDEWNRLLEFLEQEKPFTWWRVIDAGGAGKSRIAQELCWHAVVEGWTAGFLQPTDAETWSRWRVTQDTLIVVDYVFARWDAAALGQIVDQIAQYRGPHRVRLLVLERSDYGPWWRSFARSDGAREAKRYSHGSEDASVPADQQSYGEPLTLPPISEDALASVLRVVLETHGIQPDSEALKTHVQRFRELDPKGRPLFAAFYADAVSRDPDRPSWSRAELARSVIDQKILREHPRGHGQTPVRVDARHLNLLVLATLVGGVGRDARPDEGSGDPWDDQPESVSMSNTFGIDGLASLLPVKRDPISHDLIPDWDPAQIQLIAGYSGDYDDQDPVIPELQPDPLGEALVLERLSGRATAHGELPADAKRATEALLIAAGDFAPRYLSAWIYRARQDYPTECSTTRFDLREYERIVRWEFIPANTQNWLRVQEVNLSLADVTDLSRLRDLTNIQVLYLRGTPVSDISPISCLINLRLLNLGYTLASDISPLSGLTNLQALDLQRSQVSDLSSLTDLRALHTVHLNGTPVSDISPISRLFVLSVLSLSFTELSDITPLSGLTSLQTLYLDNTRVSDVSPLSGLTALQTLSLQNTQVSDVSPLSGLTALQRLFLWSTPVSDVSPLQDLFALQMLHLPNTQVSDVSPLSGLTALQRLDLWGTPVTDVSPLSSLTALQRLDLMGTPVSDVSPLVGLPNLTIVRLPKGETWNPQQEPPPAKYLP